MIANWEKVETSITNKPFSCFWLMPQGYGDEWTIFMTRPEAKRVIHRVFGQRGALASI